jgi:DNA polymerase-3 subunit gamma/tau
LLPFFSVIAASATATGELSPSVKIPETQEKSVVSTTLPSPAAEPLSNPAPASRMSDRDRRNKYLHTENLSTPSISGMMNGNLSQGSTEPSIVFDKGKEYLKSQSFEKEALIKAWKDFAETVDAAQLKSALSVREPELNDDFLVIYNLDNEVQRQRIVLDVKPKLLAHLHSVLHNEHIMVDFNVTENLQEIINKPYTNQEKFNVLAARYPVLASMKQRFGLDFE